jgi:hypothetical protein
MLIRPCSVAWHTRWCLSASLRLLSRRCRPGVAPGSQVETFAALRLEIDSWLWQGVPFYIRAGKSLPVTCTKVIARLREAPRTFPHCEAVPNYLRFRINPEMTIALGTTTMDAGDREVGEQVELLAVRRPGANEMDVATIRPSTNRARSCSDRNRSARSRSSDDNEPPSLDRSPVDELSPARQT